MKHLAAGCGCACITSGKNETWKETRQRTRPPLQRSQPRSAEAHPSSAQAAQESPAAADTVSLVHWPVAPSTCEEPTPPAPPETSSARLRTSQEECAQLSSDIAHAGSAAAPCQTLKVAKRQRHPATPTSARNRTASSALASLKSAHTPPAPQAPRRLHCCTSQRRPQPDGGAFASPAMLRAARRQIHTLMYSKTASPSTARRTCHSRPMRNDRDPTCLHSHKRGWGNFARLLAHAVCLVT